MNIVNELKVRTGFRAKASFVLAIAERILPDLMDDKEGWLLAKRALDKGWSWIENQEVTGNEFFGLLIDENDDGLILHEGISEPKTKKSWIAFTTAVLYLCWLAYEYKREKERPDAVHEVNVDSLDVLIEYALQSELVDTGYIEDLSRFVLEKLGGEMEELGKYVDRAALGEI